MGDLYGRFVWEICMGDLYESFSFYSAPFYSESDLNEYL